jgi:hypothetical protein
MKSAYHMDSLSAPAKPPLDAAVPEVFETAYFGLG